MSLISRRHFLEFAGSALASVGLSQLNRLYPAQEYGKVLAQSTPRKLALLVGINNYPDADTRLRGCVTDVELQRHLLIHRFGFNPKDIYSLTDEKATRQGILTAFEEYLIKQAKPGDVVVYHYSGHGSLVHDPHPIAPDRYFPDSGLSGTFVPVDSRLPADFQDRGAVVQDIMGHTLFLLMSAVNSENFTAVLDSCYSGGATRNSRVRSRNGGEKVQISPDETSYQAQWLSRLNWSPDEFIRRYRQGVAKGVVLAATQPNQTALDAQLNGFYAGAFTYLLTQYLWQATATPKSAIAAVNEEIIDYTPVGFEQTPLVEVKLNSGYESQEIYFMNSSRAVANAAVIEVKGNRAKVWLGGVDPGAIDQGTVLTVINGSGQIRLESRDGLVGEGMVQGTVQDGMLLRV